MATANDLPADREPIENNLVRHNLAANPFVPKNDRWIDKVRLAESTMQPGVLARLGADPDPVAREAAAANRGCPADVLDKLAYDPNPYIRAAVAANLNTPPENLTVLSADPDQKVRAAAAANPNRPAAGKAAGGLLAD